MERESNNPESGMVIEEITAEIMEIDPRRARFPCCIVWTPLPVISWLVPFIGHIGIGKEDGVILDFSGPHYVCVDNFTFGAVKRYLKINREKCCFPAHSSADGSEDRIIELGRELSRWDYALRRSTLEFQHRAYNFLTCNGHSFVANTLNKLGFQTGGWNVVNLAVLIFFKGRWVSRGAMIRSLLPFVLVFSVGLALGGTTFLKFLAFFIFALVGWFILGTYVFKNLVQL